MTDEDVATDSFEVFRPHLRAVAYRMLGSYTEAEDAVQETWVRLDRAGSDGVGNLKSWLTTILARVCLDRMRSRQLQREEPTGAQAVGSNGEPVDDDDDPEQQVLLADALGSALLVVLDVLSPAERIAFVLHDIFAVPFNEIGPIVGRSADATRQLASRARRRIQRTPSSRRVEVRHQRELVHAFLTASRQGEFGALLAVLDPDVIFQADETALRLGAPLEVHGANAVAKAVAGRAWGAQLGLVDGGVGLVYAPGGRPQVAFRFAYTMGRIAAINMIADPERVAELDLELSDPGPT